MKKITCLYLLGLGLLVAGCKKKSSTDDTTPANPADTTPPVITLNGQAKDTVFLNGTYGDPGATAIDNKDGDISAFIVVSGTVNTNLAGDYNKNYDVRDAAGNAVRATRNIHVKNKAEYLEGTYLASCACATMEPGQTTLTSNSTYTATIVASSTVNNSFYLDKLVNATGITSGYNLQVNGQGVSGVNSSMAFPGTLTGTVGTSNTSFTVNTFNYIQMYPSRTLSCTNVFTKQ
jgi:hypothetical protein